MGFSLGRKVKKVVALKTMSLVLMLVFVGSAFGQISATSPEGAGGSGGTSRCRRDVDCPPPIPEPGQEMSCLESRCVAGVCSVTVLSGRYLGRDEQPSDLSCFKAPVVCDGGARPVLSTDPQRRIPIRENGVCSLGGGNQNPCERPACQAGSCVRVAYDGADCSDTRDPVGECQKKECQNRECRAVVDAAKKGVSCVNPVTGNTRDTENCRTTEYSCNEVGVCQGAEPKIATNAECASNPNQLAPLSQLPVAFKNLMQNGTTFPAYTCDTATCKITFCGDGAVNGSEECDGAAFKAGTLPGARCGKNCKVERCGDGIRNGTEACDGADTPLGTTCLRDCTLCGDTVVQRIDLCTGPRSGIQSPQRSVDYWLEQLGFSSYKNAVSTNKAIGVLFTYTNEQGNKCWVDHAMYDGPAPGLGVCWDGNYEKFEFHCSTCSDTGTTCYDRFADKPGVQVMALGVAGDGNCVSGAARAAYQRFKNDFQGYESVLTGLDLGYSPDRSGVYGAPAAIQPASSAPKDMVTCEVCYWPVCGNGKRTPDEQCDGSALPPGALPGGTCSADCRFHGSISLQASGTCTVEPEGGTATSVICRLASVGSWSEGKYNPRSNPLTLGQPDTLRTIQDRALTSSGQLCNGVGGGDPGIAGVNTSILTASDVALNQIGAPYGTIEFLCIKKVP
jgi:hypothetical protein